MQQLPHNGTDEIKMMQIKQKQYNADIRHKYSPILDLAFLY